MKGEKLEIVDRSGNVLGLAERQDIHGNPDLIHRVVHILVFNSEGELLLQKRSLTKDVAPGKWDTSVGGHVMPGEDIFRAASREMLEELGLADIPLGYLYDHLFSNHRESELVSTFSCIYEGELAINRNEIDEVKFWDLGSITESATPGIFSAHLLAELRVYQSRIPTGKKTL